MEQTQCTKVKFTKQEASHALDLIKKRGRQHQREQRYYYCAECNAWHLTSKEFFVGKQIEYVPTQKERWEALLKQNEDAGDKGQSEVT